MATLRDQSLDKGVEMDKEVDGYIEKQNSPQKEILKRLRKIILKTLPNAGEEMKWGTPVFGGGKFYIVALKDHVNIGFAIEGLSEKEKALFEGKGKTMRHVKVNSLKDLDEKKLVGLLKLVDKKAKCEC